MDGRRNVLKALSYNFVFAASYDHGGEIHNDKETVLFHTQCDALNQFIYWWQCYFHSLVIYFIIEDGGAIKKMCLNSFMEICEKLIMMLSAQKYFPRGDSRDVFFYGSKLEQYFS